MNLNISFSKSVQSRLQVVFIVVITCATTLAPTPMGSIYKMSLM
jgi:hypothetical protein